MKRWARLTVIMAVLVAGCGDEGSANNSISGFYRSERSGSGGAAPTLVIHAIDVGLPIDEVVSATVGVKRIDIRMVGGSFQTLIDYSVAERLDLTSLTNGLTQQLGAASPPPGSYDAVRLVLTSADITILDNGIPVTFPDLKVPSGQQSGIKLFVEFDVVTQLTTDLLLVFDLSRSYILQGNPDTPAGIKGVTFKPVSRAVNISTAGSVTGLVLSDNGTPDDDTDDFPLLGAQVDLTSQSTQAMVTAFTDANGFFLQPGLPEGDYDVDVSATDHRTDMTVATVSVANLTDFGIITLERRR